MAARQARQRRHIDVGWNLLGRRRGTKCETAQMSRAQNTAPSGCTAGGGFAGDGVHVRPSRHGVYLVCLMPNPKLYVPGAHNHSHSMEDMRGRRIMEVTSCA